jgi:hypothetical protein
MILYQGTNSVLYQGSTSQAAQKLDTEGGGGFNPRIKLA